MDFQLLSLVKLYGESSWNRVSKLVGVSEIKCHKRYLELSNRAHLVSAPWSIEEDETLAKIVLRYGAKNWSKIA